MGSCWDGVRCGCVGVIALGEASWFSCLFLVCQPMLCCVGRMHLPFSPIECDSVRVGANLCCGPGCGACGSRSCCCRCRHCDRCCRRCCVRHHGLHCGCYLSRGLVRVWLRQWEGLLSRLCW